MASILRFWPLLFLIPFVGFGFFSLFYPQRVMQFIGRMMNPLDMDDETLDHIPTIPGIRKLLLGNRSNSEFINTMKHHPEELRYHLAWARIFGFLMLLMIFLSLCVALLVIESGAVNLKY
ncbi:MAG: hypothetical protein K1X65_15610 [Caldilineales bacterium]|nr:hypothetical protein [Caldilineales bacterium]MCW5857572.1 hypothetical protein [Caldilineales bacterium]